MTGSSPSSYCVCVLSLFSVMTGFVVSETAIEMVLLPTFCAVSLALTVTVHVPTCNLPFSTAPSSSSTVYCVIDSSTLSVIATMRLRAEPSVYAVPASYCVTPPRVMTGDVTSFTVIVYSSLVALFPIASLAVKETFHVPGRRSPCPSSMPSGATSVTVTGPSTASTAATS